MKVLNKEFRFSFEIPDEYREISKSDYEKFNIDESTLHVFVKMEGNTPRTISINRDDTFADEDDYLALIQLNASNMEKMEMKITNRSYMTTERGRRIDKISSEFKGLKFCTYFTRIGNMLIAASVEVNADRDEHEAELYSVFASINEQ